VLYITTTFALPYPVPQSVYEISKTVKENYWGFRLQILLLIYHILLEICVPWIEVWLRFDWDSVVDPCKSSFFFRLVKGGVQLGPLGTAATDWPIVACPGWLLWWRIWWNEDWQGKPKYSEEPRPSTTLSTTNPTWLDPGSNPGRRGGKPATNRLSYGAGTRAYLNPQSLWISRVWLFIDICSSFFVLLFIISKRTACAHT
jgi:hypothetical protein